MNPILKFICGTSETSPSSVWTNGITYDLTTHSGALRWRVHCIIGHMRGNVWPPPMKRRNEHAKHYKHAEKKP